jgi:hypothetical protein
MRGAAAYRTFAIRAFENQAGSARVDSVLTNPGQGNVRVGRAQLQTLTDLLLRHGGER